MKHRVLAHVRTDDSGCWVWTGSRLWELYGAIRIGGKNVPAHRAAYEAWVGPIPDGLVVDHLCHNTLCCNPEHLEPVTRQENLKRRRKTGSGTSTYNPDGPTGCGTPAGYMAHKRRTKDAPCPACKASWNEYNAELRRRRRAAA